MTTCPVCGAPFAAGVHPPDPDCALSVAIGGRTTLLPDALALAAAGWLVFGLHGKTPYGNCPACPREERHKDCPHPLCHGMVAATADPTRLAVMWAMRPEANIGLRPAPGYFVLDVDPRNGGALPPGLPETLTVRSGREDGGVHLYFRGHQPARIGDGIDVKGWGGYVVAPPSIHPETRRPYRWVDPSVPIATWPVELAAPARPRSGGGGGRGPDIPLTWEDVLSPHGWTSPVDGDWLHPRATTSLSARVIDDLLYVFTTSTDFETTEGGSPRGYGRLEAYALLNDHDNLLIAYTEATK